jgi:ketosteroid isomerase-like protein
MPNPSRRRRRPILLAATALCIVALPAALAGARPAATADFPSHAHDFERFLHRYQAANTAFVNGNPSPWLALTATKDPVSIFGGFGGLGEAGVAEVHQRYLRAATAFQPSGARVDFEYLVKDVQGRLAYTVAIERSNVLYTGQTESRPQILRVTMLFRREHGDWKIVHRHADTMTTLQLPS